jgi:hypothetical protein
MSLSPASNSVEDIVKDIESKISPFEMVSSLMKKGNSIDAILNLVKNKKERQTISGILEHTLCKLLMERTTVLDEKENDIESKVNLNLSVGTPYQKYVLICASTKHINGSFESDLYDLEDEEFCLTSPWIGKNRLEEKLGRIPIPFFNDIRKAFLMVNLTMEKILIKKKPSLEEIDIVKRIRKLYCEDMEYIVFKTDALSPMNTIKTLLSIYPKLLMELGDHCYYYEDNYFLEKNKISLIVY